MSNLTHLLLHPHAPEHDDAYIRLSGVQAVVTSPHLKNLTHLQLRCSDIGDRGCTELVQSSILKRLRVLDLRQGEITDEGASILAACPDIAKLEVLDLLGNKLTQKGIQTLKAVIPRMQPNSEKTNQRYQFDGDME
jgi:Ran GTPase-activating protein (RanGAP) involved in mRNA processing and transport